MEWIDLGLPSGTKWANCNIGATTPEDFGNYFAWSELNPKLKYLETNNSVYKRSITELYNSGIIDINNNLTSGYDTACNILGKDYHIPTVYEIEELINECVQSYVIRNGIHGYCFIGLNGNSIFIPFSGVRVRNHDHGSDYCGKYWSSEAYDGGNALALRVARDESCVFMMSRFIGATIRPVKSQK